MLPCKKRKAKEVEGVSVDKRPEVMAMQEWQLRVERRVVEEAESATIKAIVIGFLLVVRNHSCRLLLRLFAL